MIPLRVVQALLGLLTLILEAIPDGTLPVGDYVEDFATAIGGALGGLDGFLPITEMSVVVGWIMVTYVPIVVTYHIVRWAYTHLPVIGNGG